MIERQIPEEQESSSTKRRFNNLVNNPVMEDYSLRYAPSTFRKWSEYAVATSALGGIAYLADFAIGASIFVTYGFTSAVWAIIAAAVVIFLTGIPIAYYSARYNIDMDLLTRGAGFGYLGSTITSLIYASFTFIFFSLEGSIMAQALNLYFGLPLPWAYLVCALLIIPLVVFGMTLLSKLQVWTQPIWLVLLVLPFLTILIKDPGAYSSWTHFAGSSKGAGFNFLSVGLGAGVALSLIAQIGEQVDYLRFMPDKTPENSKRWWMAVMSAGPGWVILGAIETIGRRLSRLLYIRHRRSYPGCRAYSTTSSRIWCPDPYSVSGINRCNLLRCTFPGKDQRHQCLFRFSFLVELLFPHPALASGTSRLAVS